MDASKCGQTWTSFVFQDLFFSFAVIYTTVTLAFADIKKNLSTKENILFLDGYPFSGVLKKNEDDVRKVLQYLNGQRHGIQRKYFTSGQIKEATMFTNGKENGRCIRYFECGAKKMNANYRTGQLDGLYEEWDQNGITIARNTYYNGRLIAASSSTKI
jgi:antitoxin component YwqK of YwqJK toxin-antitoxin module